MAHKAKTFCRNCGALCSMEVTVDNGRVVEAAPDPDAVSPYGAYMCPKGAAAVDFHNGAEGRLLHSLKRDASRGLGGDFAPIAAERALDEIAAKIGALIAEHGPRSVAVFHGTGAYRSVLGGLMEKAFLAAIGSPNLFSTMTIDQSAKWVTSGRMGVMASGKPSFKDVDVGLLAGNNPVVSHQTYPFGPGESGAPARAFAEARARGVKLIVVDPRRTETARYADLLIQPLPGHDAEIFAAIAHILLRDGTYNRAFCDRFVSQMDELRAAVAPFTPKMAAERAEVPVEQIEEAARLLGAARRPFVGSGSGPSMSAHSNLADHMIEAVNALVGGYRRAGDLVRNPGALKPRVVKETAAAPTRTWETGVKCRTADIGKLFGEFPTARLPEEITVPGPDRIRALIVFGGNPLMALGHPDKAIPAFQDLELLVSLDARLNETARLAHYVIATTQPFERHDLSVPGDGLYPEAFAQYAAPVVPKPPGLIDDWEFFWATASRLRLPLTFKYWTYGLDFDSIPDGLDLDVDVAPDPEDLIRHLCRDSRVSFEELKANPSGVRPQIAPQHVEAVEDNGARLEICPPDIAQELAAVLAETADSRFRYQLTCRRILEAMNSAYRQSRGTGRKYPVNWAYMNPQDMAADGIAEGAPIEITSEAGRIIGVARAEDRLRRGVVSMTHLFGAMTPSHDPWSQGGSNTGQLTSLDQYLEPINFMPRFSGIPVNVRAAAVETQAAE
ncbi:molybdopterin-dependent oxidoreductase [Phenylobacterium sp. LjRoot225]|uniref:molybdopterin-containing oxidoreductase family protein n=1 Tax=Phenylobacterium sp. LjRoot225 TaxID=3342285 RepID=UPI003ECCD72A